VGSIQYVIIQSRELDAVAELVPKLGWGERRERPEGWMKT
jgi:hypothetical protein